MKLIKQVLQRLAPLPHIAPAHSLGRALAFDIHNLFLKEGTPIHESSTKPRPSPEVQTL